MPKNKLTLSYCNQHAKYQNINEEESRSEKGLTEERKDR